MEAFPLKRSLSLESRGTETGGPSPHMLEAFWRCLGPGVLVFTRKRPVLSLQLCLAFLRMVSPDQAALCLLTGWGSPAWGWGFRFLNG